MLADNQMTEMKKREERHHIEKERLENAANQAEDRAKQHAENAKAIKAAFEQSNAKMQGTLAKQHHTQIEQLRKQTENQVAILLSICYFEKLFSLALFTYMLCF